MESVEELLTVLLDCAYSDSLYNLREHGKDDVYTGLQILLKQYKTPYRQRDPDLIRKYWNIINSEGRKTKLFKGLEVSPDCKADFTRFIKNDVH